MKVVIMAGGKGTRISSVASDIPKPMIKIDGIPVRDIMGQVDIVQAKVDMINNHKSPIQDDYIEKYLAEKELNLTATLDAKAAY